MAFTNDKLPRLKKYCIEYPQIWIKKGASIGANSTILPGVTIGASSMIGAGTVVTKDDPDNAVVVGNPGKIVRYP